MMSHSHTVNMGTKVFDEDCEGINAPGSGVSGADCAVMAARMAAGKFKRLKCLDLVRFV